MACQGLFKQTKLLSGTAFLINFIIKAAYVVYCQRIICKVSDSALSDSTALYVFAETAYFPVLIKILLSCHV